MKQNNFSELKERILASAKSAHACKEQYKRAYSAETAKELMEVVKDNFHWCAVNKVLTVSLIEESKALFAEHGILCNESADSGYLLADNATVEACGNAVVEAWGNAVVEARDNVTVRAWDTAVVEAWDTATVRAWGNAVVEAWNTAVVEAWDTATVRAWGNATVRAWGNAYITSYDIIECRLSGKAIHRIQKTNAIRFASDELKFERVYENRAAE